jgi:hypothetical protein
MYFACPISSTMDHFGMYLIIGLSLISMVIY